MSEYPVRVRHVASLKAVWLASAMVMICAALPAFAAERIVLCEEFTDYW